MSACFLAFLFLFWGLMHNLCVPLLCTCVSKPAQAHPQPPHPTLASTSVRFLPFLSFIMLILAGNAPLIFPIFLKWTLVFPIFFSTFSLYCSFRKGFLSLLAILWSSEFSWVHLFLSLLPFIVLSSQIVTLLSFISFSLEWFWSLLPVQSYVLLFIVVQALCLPDLTTWTYSSSPLYNHKGFYLGHTWVRLLFITSMFLDTILLVFSLLHFELWSQTCLLFQISLDFLLFHSNSL